MYRADIVGALRLFPSGGKELKVNGKAIDRRYDLKDGDIVEVGNLKLQFYVKE